MRTIKLVRFSHSVTIRVCVSFSVVISEVVCYKVVVEMGSVKAVALFQTILWRP